MKILVNNESKSIEVNSRLAELLESLKMSEETGFAVAVNNEVVPRAKWRSVKLNENDKVIIIRATQGG